MAGQPRERRCLRRIRSWNLTTVGQLVGVAFDIDRETNGELPESWILDLEHHQITFGGRLGERVDGEFIPMTRHTLCPCTLKSIRALGRSGRVFPMSLRAQLRDNLRFMLWAIENIPSDGEPCRVDPLAWCCSIEVPIGWPN